MTNEPTAWENEILAVPSPLLSLGLLSVAVAAGAALRVDAAPASIPTTTIQTAYDQMDQAFAQRDLTRCMAYFTPDYTDQDEKGMTINLDQVRQRYQDHLEKIKTVQCHYTIQSLVPTPAGTLVEMRMHADGTGEKKILFATVKGTFTNDLWVRDLWVSTPQGWRLKHRQTLLDETHTHPG